MFLINSNINIGYGVQIFSREPFESGKLKCKVCPSVCYSLKKVLHLPSCISILASKSLKNMNKQRLIKTLMAGMLLTLPAQADVIKLQTEAPVGSAMSLAIDQGVKATLTWGNGNTQEITFTAEESVVNVADASLTITTEQPITVFFCVGNSLTELNLSEAPHLTNLVCADNHLSALNLDRQTELVELNCQNNNLSALALGTAKQLQILNCAGNQIEKLTLSGNTALRTLICANNKLTSLSISALKQLEALWCQGNEIKTLQMTVGVSPKQILAYDNVMTTARVTNSTGLEELWLDNNQLTSLDVSGLALVGLSASNNALTSITHSTDSKKTMKYFYVDGNNLDFSSFVTTCNTKGDTLISYAIDPQAEVSLGESVNIGEEIDLTEKFSTNGWKAALGASIKWYKSADNSLLVKGTDYTVKNTYKFTFLTPQKGIYAVVTATRVYPDFQLTTQSLRVIDPSGIGSLADNSALMIKGESGALQVVCGAAMPLKVYAADGRTVLDTVLSAGTHTWKLPAGVYVVNGEKVYIAR